MYCFPVDFLQEAMRMSMVSGDNLTFVVAPGQVAY